MIHDNYANGLHMNGDVSMGGDGTITSPVVEGNYIFNNGVGGGSGINMDGVERAMIRNNVIVNAHASGISMYQIDGGICSRNNTVYHNTIVVAADGRWAINIPNNGCTGNQLIANILYSNHSYRGAINIVDGARSGFASNHNVLEGVFSTNGGDSILTFTQWKTLGYDANSKVSTPTALFVNPSSDFHLKSGSPAINIGTTLASVKTDFDGRVRPQGASSDAGAFEAASPADCRHSPTSGPVYTRITVTCSGFHPANWSPCDGTARRSHLSRRARPVPASVTFSAPRSVSGRHLVKAVGDKGTSVPSRGFVITPSLALSPTGGVIGRKITATMRGFAAGEVITLRVPDRARQLPYGREEHHRLQHRHRLGQPTWSQAVTWAPTRSRPPATSADSHPRHSPASSARRSSPPPHQPLPQLHPQPPPAPSRPRSQRPPTSRRPPQHQPRHQSMWIRLSLPALPSTDIALSALQSVAHLPGDHPGARDLSGAGRSDVSTNRAFRHRPPTRR